MCTQVVIRPPLRPLLQTSNAGVKRLAWEKLSEALSSADALWLFVTDGPLTECSARRWVIRFKLRGVPQINCAGSPPHYCHSEGERNRRTPAVRPKGHSACSRVALEFSGHRKGFEGASHTMLSRR